MSLKLTVITDTHYYSPQTGTSGKAYKTLLTNLKVVKLDGSVVKTEVIGGADKGYVDFAISEEYGSSIFAAEETFKVGEGVDAESYFGYASTVFVKKLSNNKYEIIAIMPGAESTIVELGLEDIDTIDTTKVEYYTDADKYDTKKLTLDDTAITSAAGVYLNYAEVGVNALNTAIGAANDMEITVIENTGDNKYDMIIAKEYAKNKYEIIAIMPGAESTVVELGLEDIETIDATKVEYYTDADHYNTKKYNLDASVNSDGVYYNYVKTNITGLNGQCSAGDDVEFTLIENTGDNKFDMIVAKEYKYDRVDSIEAERDRFIGTAYTFVFDFEDEAKSISIVDENGEAMELKDFAEDDVIAFISSNGNGRNHTWIEVINLGKKTVEGTVNETKTDAVYVDGVEYGKAGVGSINLGDEGVFYLTRTGKIFDFEKSASVAGNYAYILGTAISNNGGWDNAWQVKMLTKDNEIVTYTVKDGFDLYDKDGNIVAADLDKDASSAGLVSALDITVNSASNAFKTNVASRIVTYKLDSNGLIREIAAVDAYNGGSDNYNADAEKLFTSFETDAVIFNLTGARDTGSFVTDASSLVDDNNYTGWYVRNEDSEVDCLIITAGAAAVDYTQDLAIITGVTSTKVNEEDAMKVRYYVSSEEELKEIIIMEDTAVSVPCEGTAKADIKVGAAMMFTADADGVASAYAVLAKTAFAANAANSAARPYVINATLEAYVESAANNLDTEIVYGYIADTAKVSKGTKVIDGLGNEYVILGSTNAYTIKDDAGESKARVFAGDWQATASIDTYVGHANGKANYFIAKIVDDKVADFITFARPFQVD